MNLKALREQAGLTQAEAAQLVHRTRDSWAAYESGRVEADKAVVDLFKIKTAPMIKAREQEGL